jgi:hypothetical protein
MIEYGTVKKYWSEEYLHFPYEKKSVSESDLEIWKSQGYDHKSFNGSMFGGNNTLPEWVYFVANDIGLTKTGFVFYKMITGDIMPMHIDHFSKYCEIFKVKKSAVCRAVIFLENWKSGHYFEIDNKAYCNYKAGEYVLWTSEEPHFAANIGLDNRYTLQITGVKV